MYYTSVVVGLNMGRGWSHGQPGQDFPQWERRDAMENRAQRRRTAKRTLEPVAPRATAAQATSESAVAEPQALVVSHFVDSGEEGKPYMATLRLWGARATGARRAGPQDSFVREDVIEVDPGSGPHSVTSWIYGVAPGEWMVDAELLRPRNDRRAKPVAETVLLAEWSWRRWRLVAGPRVPIATRWARIAPMSPIPAVLPGSFPALGALAIVVALLVQAAFVARLGLPVMPAFLISLLALLAGLLAAKLWYAFLHPGPWRQALLGGWAVDGFLVVAPAVAVAGVIVAGLPIGPFLDATAPGMFLAVAVGRLGCFFTGCCAGRPTRSRFGVWSSDRKIGARRIPAQLIESAAGLAIGSGSGVLVASESLPSAGVIFVVALTVYVAVRVVLLRLRAERRDHLWRRSTGVSPSTVAQ